eukprot:4094958-Prymnesium_polylepis.1
MTWTPAIGAKEQPDSTTDIAGVREDMSCIYFSVSNTLPDCCAAGGSGSANEDPPPIHRGRPVESRSTVPRFHTEL